MGWVPLAETEDWAVFGQKPVGTSEDIVKGAMDNLQDALEIDLYTAGTERAKYRSACLLRLVVDQDAKFAKVWKIGSLAVLRPCQTC